MYLLVFAINFNFESMIETMQISELGKHLKTLRERTVLEGEILERVKNKLELPEAEAERLRGKTLTAELAAKLIGITPRWLSEIETGKVAPVPTLTKVAALYNFPASVDLPIDNEDYFSLYEKDE